MNCSSSYEASSLVNGFHSIPHVDIDLNQSPSDFQISLDYFEAVIIWACVPILVVVCLFVLMSVYFICVCCCCCFQQHEKRSTCSKATCGVLVTLLVALCLAMVGVGLWAEFEWDNNLNQFVSTATDTDSLVGDIQSQAASYNSDALSANLTILDQAIPVGEPVRDAVGVLIVANQDLTVVFDDISSKASLDSLSTVLNVASTVELARHWAVVAYLIVITLTLIILALSLCCSAACRSPICVVLTLFFFSFMTFTAWVAVGGNLAYLVVAGDICYDPDNLIRNYTSNAPNATIPSGVVDYYLVCNETCVSSPFQEAYNNASEAFDVIPLAEEAVRDYINGSMPDLLPNVDSVVMLFNSAEYAINNLTMLSECTRINRDYTSVLQSFCTDGYLYSLVLFGMICGLAVGMLVAVICSTFYAGLLSSGKEYDEETVVYDFPESQSSPWDSYGGGQNFARGQYSQFREEYHLRSSPPTDDPAPPPKYTDLSTRTTSMDNGADPTIEHRPVSGAYDHFVES